MRLKKISYLVIVSLLLFVCGCTVNLFIKNPAISSLQYSENKNDKVIIKIVDNRSNKTFHMGAANLKKMVNSGDVTLENMESPLFFLSENLEKECVARGIPAKIIIDNTGNVKADIVLEILVYQIVSRRVAAYTPWESTHSFKAVLSNSNNSYPIYAYFIDGKVPMWSINEIEEPCFNRPISIITKEIVSKMNSKIFQLKMTDKQVAILAKNIEAELGKEDDGPYIKLLELGASNNISAISHLKKFAGNSDMFFRACAISCIGIIDPVGNYDFLLDIYKKSDGMDKYMALKSIGDCGTEQAQSCIKEAKNNDMYNKEIGFKKCVDLYIN